MRGWLSIARALGATEGCAVASEAARHGRADAHRGSTATERREWGRHGPDDWRAPHAAPAFARAPRHLRSRRQRRLEGVGLAAAIRPVRWRQLGQQSWSKGSL